MEYEFVCPKCGESLTYSTLKNSDGTENRFLNWNCSKCGALAIKFTTSIITDNKGD